ncbi:MAG: single-stranded DNA-binding protein [Proteobacteria bacterium]|nr:single-stranded DNA-binding protein [Pseudomonadota bacterium]
MLKSNVIIVSGKIVKTTAINQNKKKGIRSTLETTDSQGNKSWFVIDAADDLAQDMKKFAHVIVKGRICYEKNEANTLVYVKANEIHPVNGMIPLNNVTLSGNVTRDIEMRSVPNKNGGDDYTVSKTVLAFNDFSGNTHFVSVEAWEGLAKSTENLMKGSTVEVRGRLIQKSWDNGNSSMVMIRANEIDFVRKPARK